MQYDEHDYEIVGNKSALSPAAVATKDLPTPEETPKQPFKENQFAKSEERKVEEEEPSPKAVTMEEIMKQNEGYSLISEIYINDGYNHSSLTNSTSSLSDVTDHSSEKQTGATGEDQRIKIKASEGHLTIELEDDPKDYPIVTENFEPDTLDRKDFNNNRHDNADITSVSDIYMDSLERTPLNTKRLVKNNLKTLRNIFELNSKMLTGQDEGTGLVAKQFNGSDVPPPNSLLSYNFIPKPPFDIHSDDEGGGSDTDYSQLSWCTSSEKQTKFTKRQRPPSPPKLSTLPQSQTPPKLPPRNNASHDYYEFSVPSKNPITEIVPPLPPRSIKPPLPPKNSQRRSTDLRKFMNRPLPDLPEDTVGTSVSQEQEIYVAVDEEMQSREMNKDKPDLPSRKNSEKIPQETESDNIYNEIKSEASTSAVANGFEFNNQKNLTPFEIFQLKRSRKLVRMPSIENQLEAEQKKKEIQERLGNDTNVKQHNKNENRKDIGKPSQELSIKEQMNKVLKQIAAKGNTFDRSTNNKSDCSGCDHQENAKDSNEVEEPYYNVRTPSVSNDVNDSDATTDRESTLKSWNSRNGKKGTETFKDRLASFKDKIGESSQPVQSGGARFPLNRLKHKASSTPSSPASSLNEFYENRAFLNDSQTVAHHLASNTLIKSFRKLSESSEYEFILPRNKHDSNVIIRHKSKHHASQKANNDSGYLSTSTSSGSETDENVGLDSDFSNDNESTSTNFKFYKH